MPLPEVMPLTDTFSTAGVLVQPHSKVLDVGCNNGEFARHLSNHRCTVTGIEVDEAMARRASTWCERTIVADIETVDLDETFGDERFDVITCLDVLEHLKDPVAALRRIVGLLKPGGRLVFSIPNITHGAMRLQLLRGDFNRTHQGLLDRTHLQFFDRAGLEEMLADAGLRVTDRLYVRRGLSETEIDLDLAAFPAGAVTAASAGADADVYQFVWSVVPMASQLTTIGAEALWFELEQARAEAARVRPMVDANRAGVGREDEDELRHRLANTMRALEHRDEATTQAKFALGQAHSEIARLRRDVVRLRRTLNRERQRVSYRATQRTIRILRRVPPLWGALRLVRRAVRRR